LIVGVDGDWGVDSDMQGLRKGVEERTPRNNRGDGTHESIEGVGEFTADLFAVAGLAGVALGIGGGEGT
jgi:hypothetical protein